jgi:putative membrane protein
MLSYDSRNWLKALAFHKSDTFRKLLPLLVVVGLYSAAIAYLEFNYFKVGPNSRISNITVMHSLLGFAISMLLVFRTNTAYDRWWEGRKLWGSLVNVSRNFASRMGAFMRPDDEEERAYFASLIPVFARELNKHLNKAWTQVELDEEPHPEILELDRAKHAPAQVVGLMHQRIMRLHREGALSSEQLIILNTDITAFLDICGACERIKNTPIPYSYTTFLKKFIVIYVITLPMGFAFDLGYLAVPVVMFIFYVLASLELIAEEIEEPFGNDRNDLPLDKLCTTIERSVKEILD